MAASVAEERVNYHLTPALFLFITDRLNSDHFILAIGKQYLIRAMFHTLLSEGDLAVRLFVYATNLEVSKRSP